MFMKFYKGVFSRRVKGVVVENKYPVTHPFLVLTIQAINT